MFRNRTPEEQAARDAERAAERAAKDAERARIEAERQQREFDRSPIGIARTAYGRGDRLLQISLDLDSQQPWLIPMTGVGTVRASTDPNEVLNGIAAEGWDLVTAGFPFLEEGSISRDAFLRSGQQVSVKGSVVGFYVFRRRDEQGAP
jgi:hypothetical protein